MKSSRQNPAFSGPVKDGMVDARGTTLRVACRRRAEVLGGVPEGGGKKRGRACLLD